MTGSHASPEQMQKSVLLPGLFLNLPRPLITAGQGHEWVLKTHFTCLTGIMSLMAQEKKQWPIFSGVRGVWVMGQQVAPPPVLHRCPGTGVFEEFKEPKKWMWIQLCFHFRGQAKQTTGQKEPGKGKKKYNLPTKCIFKHLFFLCSCLAWFLHWRAKSLP